MISTSHYLVCSPEAPEPSPPLLLTLTILLATSYLIPFCSISILFVYICYCRYFLSSSDSCPTKLFIYWAFLEWSVDNILLKKANSSVFLKGDYSMSIVTFKSNYKAKY